MNDYLNEKKKEVLKMSNIESNAFTRECICTALLSLMAAQTFEQITVTDIIKKAGVSRGGFYRNYRSKDEVLLEICEELFHYILDYMTKHKIYENTLQWLEKFFMNIAENQQMYHLLMNAKAPQNLVLNFDEELVLKEMQREETALEQYRAVVIAKGLKEAAEIWVRKGMKESPKEMAEIMQEIFFANAGNRCAE